MAVYNKMLDAADWRDSSPQVEHKPVVRRQKLSVIRKHGVLCTCCRTEIRHETGAGPDAVIWENATYCATCYTLHKKSCVVCVTPFVSRVNNKLTCGSACATTYYLTKQRKKQQELRALAQKDSVSFNFGEEL